MKLRVLLFSSLMLLSAGTAWADVEINEENFPDANFRNYLLSQDYGSDRKLTDAEIAEVKILNVSFRSIHSLHGIEYFTALKRLDCYQNQLTSLDLSKNTALTTLWCSNNQLTSLDVSKNTALTMLNCHLNQLTFSSLNVSGCIALTTLMCNDNYLTSLDLSRNTALTRLECYSNPLTSLDLSKNTKLDSLYCYSNLLTSLDVSKNTALKYLDCYNNQLTSLDVSKNTALQSLGCHNNQLTSLDVSKNTALKYLGCHNNQLTSLDVSKNTALTWLSCYSNQLTSLDMSKYTNTKPSYIEYYIEYYIACYQNQIKGAAMDALIASLPIRSNSTMRVIYYENEQNEMTITQVSAAKAKGWTPRYTTDGYDWKEYNGAIAINEENFPDAKFRNYLLSRDYGSDGKLTNEEIAGVTSINVSYKSIQSLKGIEYFTALTELRCGDNWLTSLDVSGCTALERLECYHNHLTSLDVSKNTRLYLLYCYDNQLTSLDVSKNTALRTLTCNHNNLTSLDVSNNTRLYLLECYNNQLTSLDVSKNTALQSLRCHKNQLTSLVVSKNTVLEWLYCYQNRIKGDAMDALVTSLPNQKNNCEMQVIYNENEQNVMTTTQVNVAKFKGWIPRYYDGNTWVDYAGVDPSTGVNNVETADADDTAPWYTINGVELAEKPTAPGIYIHGGKKVIVK